MQCMGASVRTMRCEVPVGDAKQLDAVEGGKSFAQL